MLCFHLSGTLLGNQRYHVCHVWPSPPVACKCVKSETNKGIFPKLLVKYNWQGPYNVNMMVMIFLLMNMTSILLPFVTRIHECSTFLIRKRDITLRHPFLFHDATKISYVLLCDNCTALKVCPYMRIFPLGWSVHLLFEHNESPYNRTDINPLSNLCSVQVTYEWQFLHKK